MTAFFRWDGDDLLLDLHIQPRASKDQFAGIHDGALKLRITAPPVDGKANAHIVAVLAAAFGVPKNRVELVSGAMGRRKRFRVAAPETLPGFLVTP